MGDIVISGPLAAVLFPAIAVLFYKLLDSKNNEVKAMEKSCASEREDKIAYRNAMFEMMKTANRATGVAERATDIVVGAK